MSPKPDPRSLWALRWRCLEAIVTKKSSSEERYALALANSMPDEAHRGGTNHDAGDWQHELGTKPYKTQIIRQLPLGYLHKITGSASRVLKRRTQWIRIAPIQKRNRYSHRGELVILPLQGGGSNPENAA